MNPTDGQTGKYQPRKGYGLRLRDVRDHDGEFFAALLSAMALTVFGYAVTQVGEWELARACLGVALWIFVGLAAWTAPKLLRGE